MLFELLAMALLCAMVVVTTLGVVDRFLLGLGLTWTEELSRFLLIWASLLAAVVAARRSEHFRVEFLSRRLGRTYARVVAGFSILVCLAAAWYGGQLAWFFRNQVSPALGLPMSLIYAAVPVGFLGIAGYLVRDLVSPPASQGEEGAGAPEAGT